MPDTFTLIQSSTVGSGGASSIEFNSIPQTYTDLMIVTSMRGTSASGPESHLVLAAFNGSSSNRSAIRLEAFGGAVGSDTFTLPGIGVTGGTGTTVSTFANGTCYIPNYTSTSRKKSYGADWASENNSTTAFDLGIIAGLWSITSAITSISVSISSTNIAEYSSAYLYGIKNS
jgi:hypothetical protein